MNEDIQIKYHRICQNVTDAKKKTKSDINIKNAVQEYFMVEEMNNLSAEQNLTETKITENATII